MANIVFDFDKKETGRIYGDPILKEYAERGQKALEKAVMDKADELGVSRMELLSKFRPHLDCKYEKRENEVTAKFEISWISL